MIKKILSKVFRRQTSDFLLNAQQYNINKKMLHWTALKTVKQLKEAGYEAYIVGGAVRDLILGKNPKDFDVATNATPDKVRKIFRRSRIVGRRFPIVHVLFGAETVEVTTFRGGKTVSQNAEGRIMRDTVYGTKEEDAKRRDFTCNALYYDPIDEKIFTIGTGMQDIQAKRLVMIGEPNERFREDPVRMLRAARISAKLEFSVEQNILTAIHNNSDLLKNEPPARLFDEITKELLCGHSSECLETLKQMGISPNIHPIYKAMLPERPNTLFFRTVLAKTDERVKNNQPVSIAFILAAMLWNEVKETSEHNIKQGASLSKAMQDAVHETFRRHESDWGMPHRHASGMRQIWLLQPAFENTKGKRPFRLLAQPNFRAAFDFFALRAKCNEASLETLAWWEKFQVASNIERNEMVSTKNNTTQKNKRRKRTVKKNNKETSE